MRIAITVDPIIPVPPDLYGGIERIVDFLVRGLIERGHEVTLFAHPQSRVPAKLVPYGVPPHWGWRPRLAELWQVGSRLLKWHRRFDLVHSFGRLAALAPILPLRSLPKVQSYQRDGVPWRSVKIATRVAGNSIVFTGCSSSVFRQRGIQGNSGGVWRTIFNGVDVRKYVFRAKVPSDAPLIFLGRIERIKGVHNAITIAHRARRQLVIAGNTVTSGSDTGYFETEIAPHIDGRNVEYVGPVNDAQKNELLGASAGLLMPIEWEEPFGIVMAEALACGTPVIGFARGSVNEIVRNGLNGYSVLSNDEAVRAVAKIDSINRYHVRADCEERFSHTTVVDSYEQLYFDLTRHQPTGSANVVSHRAAMC